VQQIQQEENVAEQHGQKTEVTKAEHSTQNVVRKNRQCSEQESDAQVSLAENIILHYF
jgi:pseudo-response regulator 5